jgi:hypothetical protein
VRVGMEATGPSRWFERLLAELGFEMRSHRSTLLSRLTGLRPGVHGKLRLQPSCFGDHLGVYQIEQTEVFLLLKLQPLPGFSFSITKCLAQKWRNLEVREPESFPPSRLLFWSEPGR